MRKGWDDALELQNALHHAMNSDEYARYLRWFCSGQSKGVSYLEYQVAPYERELSEADMSFMVGFAATTADREESDPMWVSNGVIDLVEYAAESFEPEAVYETDLIVRDAFCVFERPLRAEDIQGREIAYRAASWGELHDLNTVPGKPVRRGLLVALWRHINDEDAYSRNNPLFHTRIAGSSLLLAQTTMSPWGDQRAMAEPANHKLFAQLQVLWRLAKQRVAVGSPEKVSRPTWRDKRNWREIKHVQVFTLRRALGGKTHGEGDGAHYSHRFPVRGHWRSQWYPSVKDHRQIWIDGYVKGPEDAPFVAKHRAVEFVR